MKKRQFWQSIIKDQEEWGQSQEYKGWGSCWWGCSVLWSCCDSGAFLAVDVRFFIRFIVRGLNCVTRFGNVVIGDIVVGGMVVWCMNGGKVWCMNGGNVWCMNGGVVRSSAIWYRSSCRSVSSSCHIVLSAGSLSKSIERSKFRIIPRIQVNYLYQMVNV